MSSITNLCLNRLEIEPYLHRIIPFLTNFQQNHPGEKLVVITDKEILTKGLYLSLRESHVPVELYSQYQPIPLNLMNGSWEEVWQRFIALGLFKEEGCKSGMDALFNQKAYQELSHALTIVKAVKGNLATLHDLNFILNGRSQPQQLSQWVEKFRQMPVSYDWQRQQHVEALTWVVQEHLSTSQSKSQSMKMEQGALGRLRLEQFEKEWNQLFPKQGMEHRLDKWTRPDVVIIDVQPIKHLKEAVISYLLEVLNQVYGIDKTVHLFCDITEPLSDHQWIELLLNRSVEVTQTRHVPREPAKFETEYDVRSVKFLQYYNISNKEALLQAIRQFKIPGQAYVEKQCQVERLRRDDVLRKQPASATVFKEVKRMNERDDVVDFSDLH